MPDWLTSSAELILESERAANLGRALLLLALGLVLGRVLTRTLAALAGRFMGPARAKVVQNMAWYAVVFVVITSVLRELNFDLSVLLGAAGVLSVAIGFASQTSASNVISGIFLLVERPFEPGDVIEVDSVTGEVLGIDLMSVRLRTFDNLFVRLPNESLIKARITNLSRFPLRRVDIPVGVSYDSDLEHVRRVLERIASDEPLVLQEPAPVFNVKSLGDSAVLLSFNVWVVRDDFLAARAKVIQRILVAFREEGIEIPFPHQVEIQK